PYPTASLAYAPPRLRPGRAHRDPAARAVGAPPGRRRVAPLPADLASLDGSARARRPRDLVLHAVPVRLLPVRRRARPPARRAALLPRPTRGLRLRTGPYRALSRLPRARRAAGRAAVLRLPVRVHGRWRGRERVAHLALLRLDVDRRPRADPLRAVAVLRRERAARARVRLGAPPGGPPRVYGAGRRRAHQPGLRRVRVHAYDRPARGLRGHRLAVAGGLSRPPSRR